MTWTILSKCKKKKKSLGNRRSILKYPWSEEVHCNCEMQTGTHFFVNIHIRAIPGHMLCSLAKKCWPQQSCDEPCQFWYTTFYVTYFLHKSMFLFTQLKCQNVQSCVTEIPIQSNGVIFWVPTDSADSCICWGVVCSQHHSYLRAGRTCCLGTMCFLAIWCSQRVLL